jgi:heme exporter protein D
MMPDLGRYAFEVTTAYIVTLLMLAALIWYFVWRGARMRRLLSEVEARRGRKNA